MINLGQMQEVVKHSTKEMNVGDLLSITTFKNDRGFHITRLNDGFEVEEFGYFPKSEVFLSTKDVVKFLKKYNKREFPRSNKLNIHKNKKN